MCLLWAGIVILVLLLILILILILILLPHLHVFLILILRLLLLLLGHSTLTCEDNLLLLLPVLILTRSGDVPRIFLSCVALQFPGPSDVATLPSSEITCGMLGMPYCFPAVPLLVISFIWATLSKTRTPSKSTSFHCPVLPGALSSGFLVFITVSC